MNLNGLSSEVGRISKGCRRLFFTLSEEELKNDVEKRLMENGNGNSNPNGDDESDVNQSDGHIEAGKRSERWFDNVETRMETMEQSTISNEVRLKVLDNKITWVIRLLLGLGVTVVGGGIVELFII